MTSQVEDAVAEAIESARGLAASLRRRLDPSAAAAKLVEMAAAASQSPLAHDQLLSLALTAQTHPVRGAASRVAPLALLLAEPDPLAQMTLRQEMFAECGCDVLQLDARMAAADEERRGAERLGRGPSTLRSHLLRAAALNRALWDHPDLPVDLQVRATMLSAVAALEARARHHARRSADASRVGHKAVHWLEPDAPGAG